MAGLGPRVLQVLDFASARAPELQALHELAQHAEVAGDADAKLETQKNQRRRRANAFKRHEMPQRLRAAPKGNTSALRCRKHERRPHKLLQDRCAAADGDPERPRWLPSHLWHAKRMVMTQQFGYVLAARRADKSVSASLQALRSKATLHDASYYGVIELYGLPQVILEALQLVSDPNGSDFHGLRFLAGAEEGASMLYHEGQFPHGAIAPVTFMWRPLKKDYEKGEFKLHDEWQSAKRQLWLWVHPAAYMEAATAIASACQAVVGEEEEGIEMHDRRGQVCRLKLRGKLADELMKKLASGEDVTACGDGDMQESESSDHEDGFDEKEVVASASILNRRALLRVVATAGKKTDQERKDTVYSVAVRDPRYARCKDGKLTHPLPLEKDLSLLNEPPASEVAQVGTKAIESPLSGLDLSSLGKNAEEPESERIIKEMQALLDWTDGASTVSSGEYYPSAVPRIDQIDAAEDEGGMDIESLPSSLLWSLSRRRKLQNKFMKDHQLNEEVYRHRKKNAFTGCPSVASNNCQPLHLLLVEKREPYPCTSGWDIICPPANVPSLLKALVFGGALVVGLEEDSALSTVLHQPSFPRDYPDTQAGQAYWEAHAKDLQDEQAKKPKSKRFNYEKHGVLSPFQPLWESLFDPQIHQDSTDGEAVQTPCVLRGETYMKPFCFYTSRSTKDDNGTPPPQLNFESIVPVPMPTLVRVVVVVPKRGNIDVNAMLIAPSAEDQARFCNESNWGGDDAGWGKKKQVADERSTIGYVTSAVYDRPKGAFRAIGFITCEALQHLFVSSQNLKHGKQGHYALAMLRSSKGRMVRPVLVQAEA